MSKIANTGKNEKFRRNCVPLVAFLFLFFINPKIAFPDSSQFNEDLSKALAERSDSWAPNALDDLVISINKLQDELDLTFSEKQREDIVLGLSDRTWEQTIEDYMHPLVQQRNKLRIINRIRQYLVCDQENIQANKKEGIDQIGLWLSEKEKQTKELFPDKTEIIEEVFDSLDENFRKKVGNPLNIFYAFPVNNQKMNEVNEQWTKEVAKLSFSNEENSEDIFDAIKLVNLRSSTSLFTYYKPESPDELIELEAQISANVSEISAYQQKRYRKIVDDEQLKKEIAELTPILDQAVESSFISSVLDNVEHKESKSIQNADSSKGSTDNSDVYITKLSEKMPIQEKNGTSFNLYIYVSLLIFLASLLYILWYCNKRKRIYVFVILISLTFVTNGLCSDQNKDIKNIFKESLLKASNQWADGVVDEWATCFAQAIHDQAGNKVSEKQIYEIAMSLELKNPPIRTGDDCLHPIAREYSKQLILYRISNYLEYGSGSLEENASYLRQIDDILNYYVDTFVKKIPDNKKEIKTAQKLAFEKIQSEQHNVLFEGHKIPVAAENITLARQLIEQMAQTFTLPEPVTSSVETEAAQHFERCIMSIIWTSMGEDSKLPKLPEPQSLVEAGNAVLQNTTEIARFSQDQSDKQTEGRINEMILRSQADAIRESIISQIISDKIENDTQNIERSIADTKVNTNLKEKLELEKNIIKKTEPEVPLNTNSEAEETKTDRIKIFFLFTVTLLTTFLFIHLKRIRKNK